MICSSVRCAKLAFLSKKRYSVHLGLYKENFFNTLVLVMYLVYENNFASNKQNYEIIFLTK
jgi:hypothetical protein